jgi:hypothetical protein
MLRIVFLIALRAILLTLTPLPQREREIIAQRRRQNFILTVATALLRSITDIGKRKYRV